MSSALIHPCFRTIYGLSRTGCQCLDAPLPDGANVSDSGLFLDRAERMNLDMAKASEDCNRGTMWDILEEARTQSIMDTNNELLSCIGQNSTLTRPPYSGYIGEDSKSGTYKAISSLYHGLRMQLANIGGGFMKVKAIGLAMNITDSLNFHVYNNLQEAPIRSMVLQTQANEVKWNVLAEPLLISMAAPYGNNQPLEYYFMYQPVNGLRYKNTVVTCGCGSGFHPVFSIERPSYLSNTPKGKYGWANYALAIGIMGNNAPDAYKFPLTNDTQGIFLDVEFGCDTERTICDEAFDFRTNNYAMAYAYAALARGAYLVNDWLLSTSNINGLSLSSGETLANNLKFYDKQWKQRIEYLCTQMSRQEYLNYNSDCFSCKDTYGLVKRGILK